jgi:hypothetical protein
MYMHKAITCDIKKERSISMKEKKKKKEEEEEKNGLSC